MNSPAQLAATYFGFVETTYDALILFEACLAGKINHVARRPHDREREHVIKSGQVFIYEEHSSGIKRWTDGISWSPSRILHNFLIYRQLVRAFASGEKKKALKKPKGCPSGIQKTQGSNSRKNSMYPDMHNGNGSLPVVPAGFSTTYAHLGISIERERQLIGSLTDSYDFLDDGLVKKTISVETGGVTHHLVSYYTVEDAAPEQVLLRPSKDPKFAGIRPRHDLLHGQHFRSPIEDEMDTSNGYAQNRYESANQSQLLMGGHHMPMISSGGMHSGYPATSAMYSGNYGTPVSSAPYANSGLTYTSNTTYGQYSPSPGIYSVAQRNEAYNNDTLRRYSTGSGVGSVGSRAPMPPLPTTSRRTSTYPQPEDVVAQPEMGRFSNGDSLYGSGQMNGYYPSRDNTHSSTSTLSMASHSPRLPVPSHSDYTRHAAYDRLAAGGYRTGIDARDNSNGWSMNGNVSVGHAHYQQPQWATTSTASQ